MKRLKFIFSQPTSIWICVIFFLTADLSSLHGIKFDEEFTSAKHFIDKTSLLNEFYENNENRVFVTAPQGFGKTTNLRMIEKFSQIEVDDKGNIVPEDQSTAKKLFKNLKIGQDAKIPAFQHLAQHPVIFFDMGFHIDGEITKDKILQAYRVQLNETYSQFKWLIDERSDDESIKSLQVEQNVMRKATTEILDENEIKESIRYLANLLNAFFNNKSVVLLIDNYDSIVHESFIEYKGCLDYVYSILGEILLNCYQDNSSQLIDYTMIASVTSLGFQCFGFQRFINKQYYFYNGHKLAEYFGLNESEFKKLLSKYKCDKCKESTIQSYCGGYEIRNLNQSFFNISCVIDYLETNDNSTWVSQQSAQGPSKFIWKLLKIPEYLDQISRLIKISAIRHGRNDFLSFANFTKIVLNDFNETKFSTGVNSSIFSYLIQIGDLSLAPGDRNVYIMPNLRIRNQYMADLFYYYEKIANVDLKTIGSQLGDFFNSEKNYSIPRTNLIETLHAEFGKINPIYGPYIRNSTNRTRCSSEFIYQSIVHLAGLTNQELRVIEDYPQPVRFEKTAVSMLKRSVTCIERNAVALIIKISDQFYDLEKLMQLAHSYDIEKSNDIDRVVYLAIRVENDNRVLIDVMTSKFKLENGQKTTYHYITSYTRKTRITKIKQRKLTTKSIGSDDDNWD